MSVNTQSVPGPVPEAYLGLVSFEGDPANSTARATSIRALNYEYADGDKGLKVVYLGRREDGTAATFETGSFYDNGGVDTSPAKHDICVSTAGGCTRNCHFCSVPKAELGFERLLTADEIVAQVVHTATLRNPDATVPNVVGLMGNGEPPDNMAVIPALRALDKTGIVNRVTISTIGENIKGIGRFAKTAAQLAMPVNLQVSVHSADDEKRRLIIPGRQPLAAVMDASDSWYAQTGQPVKHNVVLMEGTGDFEGFSNATPEDAKWLASLILQPARGASEPIPRRLKLSAFNPIPGVGFKAPDQETRELFVSTLIDEGVRDIKTFKGSGIDIDMQQGTGGFACGGLRATTARIVAKTVTVGPVTAV